MPDQACANSLKLDDVPQDLDNLSTLERCLMSFRLPFMTIIVMRRYGEHYKISGPPVNVPATLDQVITYCHVCPANYNFTLLSSNKNFNIKVIVCMML